MEFYEFKGSPVDEPLCSGCVAVDKPLTCGCVAVDKPLFSGSLCGSR